jgi:hypothetical protein
MLLIKEFNMRFLILFLLSTAVHAEKLAYIHNNRVIDILSDDDHRIQTNPKFKGTLIPISEEFNEGDFICDGKKMIQLDRKAKLNDKCEWEYSLEDLEAEQEAALDRAIILELKAFADKPTVTNKEAQRAIKLLLKKLNIIEKSAE